MSAALCVLLVGAAATQSRGGAVALVVGLVPLLVVLGWRAVLRVAWRPVAGAVIAAACLVPSVSVASPSRPLPAVVGLCVGVVLAAWPRDRLPRRRTVAVAAAVVAAAGVPLAMRLSVADLSPAMVSWSSPHRVSQHRVAFAELADQPVIGTGPGRAVLRWRDDTGRTLQARFVHDEYVQVAVELGLVGLALLLVTLGAVGYAVWQGRASGGVPWAGVVAALTAFAAHGGLDFVWHLPAIPFVAMLLGGTATVPHMVGGRPVPDHAMSVPSTTIR
jgi:O-Antigen ligase